MTTTADPDLTLGLPGLWPRLIAAGVRWGPRWQARSGHRVATVVAVDAEFTEYRLRLLTALPESTDRWAFVDGWVPDTSDGPTRGGLLEEVRRLSGDPYAYVLPAPGVWFVCWRTAAGADRSKAAPIEGDALILALAGVCGVEVTGG